MRPAALGFSVLVFLFSDLGDCSVCPGMSDLYPPQFAPRSSATARAPPASRCFCLSAADGTPATTELGIDSWITSLMEVPMKVMVLNAGWVLVYTSLVMMILRFCAAPVVKWLTPIGVLLCSCILAIAGLLALSKASGLAILGAATLYGVGKTYLWPTMLGIVAERFPTGGALSINATSAVGMMSVGVMGTVFIGGVQDRAVESRLRADRPALYQQVITTKKSVLGAYAVVNPRKANSRALKSDHPREFVSRGEQGSVGHDCDLSSTDAGRLHRVVRGVPTTRRLSRRCTDQITTFADCHDDARDAGGGPVTEH